METNDKKLPKFDMDLERVKQAREFLIRVLDQRNSEGTENDLPAEMQNSEELWNSWNLTYGIAVELQALKDEYPGFISQAPEVFLENGVRKYFMSEGDINSSSTSNFMLLSERSKQRANYEDVDDGIKLLMTYESVAPVVEEVRKARITKRLDALLGETQ